MPNRFTIYALGFTTSRVSIVNIADALLFIMAIPDLIGSYLLVPVLKRTLDDYDRRRESGGICSIAGILV